jgi:hypothetical protein
MSLALHNNEPSPFNTIYCGSLMNCCREKLTQLENGAENRINKLALNRFFLTAGIFTLGLASGIEAGLRTVTGILTLPFYQAFDWSLESFMLSNAKATLLAFRVFFSTVNPLTAVSVLALSCMPSIYKNQEEKEKLEFSTLGHHLEIGAFAKIQDSNSFLDQTYAGKQINKIRENQTIYENSKERTTKELVLSRIVCCIGYLTLGLATPIEAISYLLAIISIGSFLGLMNISTLRNALNIDDEKYESTMKTLEMISSKFFISLAIFAEAINIANLFISAVEHAHPDTYKIPDETKVQIEKLKPKTTDSPADLQNPFEQIPSSPHPKTP